MKRIRPIIEFDELEVPLEQKLRYREICNIFKLEQKQGGAISNQINELQKEFKITKEGRYYMILKRLSPIDKLEAQNYENLKLHLETLLCTLFKIPNCKPIRKFTMKELMRVLQIVNEDYHETKLPENIKIGSNILGIEDNLFESSKNHTFKNSLEIFLEETEPMLQRTIKDALKSLENKKIIKLEKMEILAKQEYDDIGNSTHTTTKKVDNDNIKKDFLEAQKRVLDKLNRETEEELRKGGYLMIHKYKTMTAKELGYDYYFYEYKLILNTEYINNYAIKDIQEKIKINKICNNLVKKKILNSKQGNLSLIDDEYKTRYTDYLVDISGDFGLRDIYKETRKETT